MQPDPQKQSCTQHHDDPDPFTDFRSPEARQIEELFPQESFIAQLFNEDQTHALGTFPSLGTNFMWSTPPAELEPAAQFYDLFTPEIEDVTEPDLVEDTQELNHLSHFGSNQAGGLLGSEQCKDIVSKPKRYRFFLQN